ncbi:hypothetical protein CTAYLR_005567 [Chrysophaeum taylorii]|uniref:Palmitoyltransferase n=1 Tax=Chrysophaeum taylorii TaxID=2483200 RepID=A0AAD7U5F9_9STRA|nr:hypothetical protein CTAYLR_005567 [Chrysophaeum taylorii]
MGGQGGVVVVPGVVESKTEEGATSRARAAAQYGRLAELEELVDAGALGVNDRDEEGCTLLQWAAINGRGKVVEALLRRGADPGASGGVLDETALQWAVRQGHVETCVLIREAGCDAGHRGVEGGNAVHLACRYGKHVTAAYLLARDEVPPGSPIGLLDLPDERGRTPLMVCVEWYWHEPRGGLEMVRVLVGLGASVTFAERLTGRTALHLAAERNVERAALEVLVDAGAALEAEDGEGRTPEAVAMASGHYQTAMVLRGFRTSSCATFEWCNGCCRPRATPWCGSSSPKPKAEARPLLDDEETGELEKKNRRETTHGVSSFAAVYGFFAPWVGAACVVAVAADRGWPLAVFVAPAAAVVLVPLAPRGASRWGMCGFAACSIAVIVASFLFAGFHRTFSAAALALYFGLVAALVANFALAILTDPGIIDPPRAERVFGIVQLARAGKLAAANLCSTCLIEKPPRSKHDPTLGKCVRRFDHFCPYVANVIGEQNYLYFYLFLVFVVLAIAFHLFLVIPRLAWLSCQEGPRICVTSKDHAPLLLGTLLAILHICWVAALCGVHTSLICRDVTTYESMRYGDTQQQQQYQQPAVSPDTQKKKKKKKENCCALGLANARNSLCQKPPPPVVVTDPPAAAAAAGASS